MRGPEGGRGDPHTSLKLLQVLLSHPIRLSKHLCQLLGRLDESPESNRSPPAASNSSESTAPDGIVEAAPVAVLHLREAVCSAFSPLRGTHQNNFKSLRPNIVSSHSYTLILNPNL